MGLLDNLTGILSQYASGAAPAGDAGAHFEQVAQSVDSGTVAQGIAAALRSDQTPPFAQLAPAASLVTFTNESRPLAPSTPAQTYST